MSADAWSALAAWTALAISTVAGLLNYASSKDAKIQAKAATDRAEEALRLGAEAVRLAKEATTHLEAFGTRDAEREQLADWERMAPARARQLMDLAHDRGSQHYAGMGQLQDVPTIGSSFPVTDSAEKIALQHAATFEGVRLDPANPAIGSHARLSVPNRHYRWAKK